MLENNDVACTNQFRVVGEATRKPDVVVYLNGIPLVVIEAKSPINPKHNTFDAIDQIRGCEKEVPVYYQGPMTQWHLEAKEIDVLFDQWFAKAGVLVARSGRTPDAAALGSQRTAQLGQRLHGRLDECSHFDKVPISFGPYVLLSEPRALPVVWLIRSAGLSSTSCLAPSRRMERRREHRWAIAPACAVCPLIQSPTRHGASKR